MTATADSTLEQIRWYRHCPAWCVHDHHTSPHTPDEDATDRNSDVCVGALRGVDTLGPPMTPWGMVWAAVTRAGANYQRDHGIEQDVVILAFSAAEIGGGDITERTYLTVAETRRLAAQLNHLADVADHLAPPTIPYFKAEHDS